MRFDGVIPSYTNIVSKKFRWVVAACYQSFFLPTIPFSKCRRQSPQTVFYKLAVRSVTLNAYKKIVRIADIFHYFVGL